MNREQAESLLAQLVFDDLEEPARSQLLDYLKTDPELNERLGDMRLATRLLHDAVVAEDTPKLDESHKAELAKQIERSARKRGVIRVIGFARMHPAVAALLVISTAAILIGVLLPSMGSARRAARQMKNTTQVRGLVQGLVTYAGGNKERLPGIVDEVETADQPVAAMETWASPTEGATISDLDNQQARIDEARRSLASKGVESDIAAATDEKAGAGIVTPGQDSSDRFARRGYASYGDAPAEQSDELYLLKDQVASSSGPAVEFYSLDSAGRPVDLQWQINQDGADTSSQGYAQAVQPGGVSGGYGGYAAGEADRSVAIALNESSSETARGDSLDLYYGRQAGTAADGAAAGGAVVLGDEPLSSTLSTATSSATPARPTQPLSGGTSAAAPATEAPPHYLTPAEETGVRKRSVDFSSDKLLESVDSPATDQSNAAWYAKADDARKLGEAAVPGVVRDRKASAADGTQSAYPADWPQITMTRIEKEENNTVTLGVELKTADGAPVESTVEPTTLGEMLGRFATVEEQPAVEGEAVVGYPINSTEDPTPARKPRLMPVNPWVMTADDRLSTFALDVDTASYDIARRYINDGFLPPKHTVRMEEFVNNFDYNYPAGQDDSEAFTVQAEAGESPFGEGTVLLKVGVRGKVVGRDQAKPANLVFVVDTSGSMDRDDRLPLVRQSLAMVLDQLSPRDRVSVVSYGTEARLLVEAVPANEKTRILDALESLQTGGATNLLAGVELGYEVAQRQFITNGVNRVILNSDGVANVGPSETQELLNQAQTLRKQGVTFTSVGFGAGNYDDQVLEQLANKGDGGYLFVGSLEEAKRVFVDNLAATRPTIAFDAKIQVDFDPARVRRYRLIGYENRDIADTDFRNDSIDAGEVGSGQSATALYEIELLGPTFATSDQPDLGTVYIRYRDPDSGKVREIESRLTNDLIARRDAESDPRFFLAAGAARFAEVLRGSEYVGDPDVNRSLAKVQQILEPAAAQLPMDAAAQELVELVRRAQGLPRAE